VELYVDSRVAGASEAAETALIEHLRRHAELDELVDLAAPMVTAAVREPAEPLRWLSLDWSRRTPRLRVVVLRPDAAPAPPHGDPAGTGAIRLAPGVLLGADLTARLRDALGHASVEIDLPVVRPPEDSLDPQPVGLPEVAGEGRDAFFAATTALLAGPAVTGRSERERAAIVGASLAELVRSREGIGADPTAREVADAVIATEERLGGDFFVMETSDRRAVLGNRRCPFAVGDAPPAASMCHVTSALAGRLAAGRSQRAFVVLDERIASGDHRCRIQIDLDPAVTDDSGHVYAAPPAGLRAPESLDDHFEVTPGFRVALALVLPRDKHSVVLARRLAHHALAEAGAVEQHARDVELALAEAAANVIDHSGPGDIYRVSVEVRPETCELRVVDVGRGFDHQSLSREMAHVSAEEGRGIALMHALMDQVRFDSRPEQGTIVHLVKHLEYDERSPIRRLMLTNLSEPGSET
jgi:serine/threonine-protein kinase RsbW